MKINKWCEKIIKEVEKVIIGKNQIIKKVLATILVDGHILFEDNPGLGKTTLAKTMARVLGLKFKRIQFTPDLLPGDITGGYIYNKTKEQFELHKGPIFGNIILADEINRASPKTQSALLEAMEERQVTIEGNKMPLPNPFIVMATQNPIESEGTFPLPEAQLDRFMVQLSIGYPTIEQEQQILNNRKNRKKDLVDVGEVTGLDEILEAQRCIEDIHVDEDLENYVVRLIHQTRNDKRVKIGASPRGSLALFKLARSFASIEGRSYVIPDDIKEFAQSSLAHRLLLIPELWIQSKAAESIIEDVLKQISVPVLKSQIK